MRVPWPAIRPDRIGIIGSTQGVNASSRPAPKKPSSVQPATAAGQRGGEAAVFGLRRRSALAAVRGLPVGSGCSRVARGRGRDRQSSTARRRVGQVPASRRPSRPPVRRHRSRRQRQRHRARHRRIADAVGLAALEARRQRDVGGVGARAPQRHRHVDLVEIHDDVAEMLVAVRRRPAASAARPSAMPARRRRSCERGLVAIQVVALGRGEAQQQGVAVAGDRLEAERLLRRQRLRRRPRRAVAPAAASRVAAGEAAAERGEARRRRSRVASARQRHRQRARLRRIAHAEVGAALVFHLQRDRIDAGRRRAGQHRDQLLAVGLDLAEEFVVVLLRRAAAAADWT